MVCSGNMNALVFSSLYQAVVQMEGNNRLVANLKGLKSVTELNGDIITNVSAEERGNGWSNSAYSCLQGSVPTKPTEMLGTLQRCCSHTGSVAKAAQLARH